jgi:hypothetical protein
MCEFGAQTVRAAENRSRMPVEENANDASAAALPPLEASTQEDDLLQECT